MAGRRLREDQIVRISARATSFSAVCEVCAELDEIAGWSGSTFAGRLDLDLDSGRFLCRRGHQVQIEREPEQEHGAGGIAAA
ncbi:MAG: hypothetical protein ABR569_12150 [Gaiellaceae bacterium]